MRLRRITTWHTKADRPGEGLSLLERRSQPKMRPYWRRPVLLLLLAVALGGPTPPGAIASSQAAARQEKLQLEHLHKLQHKSKTVIRFWHNRGHWALFTHHQKCYQVKELAARK